MKKVKVTIAHLEEHYEGIVRAANVTFQVIQNESVIVKDSLSGKASHPFTKIYAVDVDESAVHVMHDRPDLSWLTITVELVE